MNRQAVATLWHRCAQIERSAIFGPADATRWRPEHRPDISALMFSGCVGSSYQADIDPLLIAINPGGGDDKELTSINENFYALLRLFKDAEPEEVLERWEHVNAMGLPVFKSWNIWNIIKPTLDAVDRTFCHVAFINAIPYRTRGNKKPPVMAGKMAWELITQPTIDLLAPREIIALGKKAGDVIDLYYKGNQRTTTVPRTNGDKHVRPEADDALRGLCARWKVG